MVFVKLVRPNLARTMGEGDSVLREKGLFRDQVRFLLPSGLIRSSGAYSIKITYKGRIFLSYGVLRKIELIFIYWLKNPNVWHLTPFGISLGVHLVANAICQKNF